jgi:hypothetical protein
MPPRSRHGPVSRTLAAASQAPGGRAVANRLHFDWLTFDESYGGKPELSARDQKFVAEVPRNFMGRTKPPRDVNRTFRKHGRRRGRVGRDRRGENRTSAVPGPPPTWSVTVSGLRP